MAAPTRGRAVACSDTVQRVPLDARSIDRRTIVPNRSAAKRH